MMITLTNLDADDREFIEGLLKYLKIQNPKI